MYTRVIEMVRHFGLDTDPLIRNELANLLIHQKVAGYNNQRAMDKIKAGQLPGPEMSIAKLAGTLNSLRLCDFVAKVLGPKLIADNGEWGTYAWSALILGTPGGRIAGGSDEIMRNIVGERVLGLPEGPGHRQQVAVQGPQGRHPEGLNPFAFVGRSSARHFALMGAFRTDWDTAANPRYDVWTTTNGGEVIPGVLSPFTATMYNQFDARGLRDLMKAYPSGNLVKVFSPPVGNFFGITAGRLTLNVGFSVAAMSCLDPDIATAMAGQFFQGSDDALRYIVRAPADKVAQAMVVATAQREAAEAQSRSDQEEFYAERLQGVAADDRALPLKKAWKRFQDLVPSTLEVFNRHLVVSTAAGEMSVRLAGVIAAGGGDPNAIIGLCSGLGDVESSKPALKLYDLALVARKHAAVRKVVESGDTAAVIAALADPPDKGGIAFADEFDEFIHRYGFRVQGEADPMVADWGENPTFVISQVKSMMGLKPAESPAAHQKAAAAARVKLEKAVRASLAADLRPACTTRRSCRRSGSPRCASSPRRCGCWPLVGCALPCSLSPTDWSLPATSSGPTTCSTSPTPRSTRW
jgi:hypothetical protein